MKVDNDRISIMAHGKRSIGLNTYVTHMEWVSKVKGDRDGNMVNCKARWVVHQTYVVAQTMSAIQF